jgi:hypothetical protein
MHVRSVLHVASPMHVVMALVLQAELRPMPSWVEMHMSHGDPGMYDAGFAHSAVHWAAQGEVPWHPHEVSS